MLVIFALRKKTVIIQKNTRRKSDFKQREFSKKEWKAAAYSQRKRFRKFNVWLEKKIVYKKMDMRLQKSLVFLDIFFAPVV